MTWGDATVSPPAVRYQRALSVVLAVQVLFSAVAFAFWMITNFIDHAVNPGCALVCSGTIWGWTGIYSALLLVDLRRYGARLINGARRIGFLVYLLQALEHGLPLRFVDWSGGGAKVHESVMLILILGLALAVATLVLLALFHWANPFGEAPVLPVRPEPEEIESSGSWDEGRK